MICARVFMRFVIRLALAAVLSAGAAYGAYLALQSARAEWLAQPDTPEALRAALRVQAGNADYTARLASLDASNDRDLRSALYSDPWRSAWWIQLSARQELDGDVAGAESSLRRANGVARYYTPRWSLAAFYYRRGDARNFTNWARLALATGTGAPESLFQMAQRLGVSADEVLNTIVPREPVRIEAYRGFALQHGDFDSAFRAAAELVKMGTAADLPGVLETCDALFRENRIEGSVTLWNSAVRAGWIHLQELDPAAGKSLGNPDFSEGVGRGFDWRYVTPPGVTLSRDETYGALRLEFSGRQPENCELFSQSVPLLPKRSYQVVIRFRTEGIAAGSGLQWSILEIPSGGRIAGGLLNSNSEEPVEKPVEVSFPFDTPAREIPTRLLMSYARPLGVARISGKLLVQSIRLTLVH